MRLSSEIETLTPLQLHKQRVDRLVRIVPHDNGFQVICDLDKPPLSDSQLDISSSKEAFILHPCLPELTTMDSLTIKSSLPKGNQ
jgi:hypothetical protein